jgi:hypothetical protein
MTDAFVLGGVRTPVGRYGGALSHLRADDRLGRTMVAACERVGVRTRAHMCRSVRTSCVHESRSRAMFCAATVRADRQFVSRRACTGGSGGGRSATLFDAEPTEAVALELQLEAALVHGASTAGWYRCPGAVTTPNGSAVPWRAAPSQAQA